MSGIEGQQPELVPHPMEHAIRLGAENASAALTRWLGREARLTVSRVSLADLGESVESLGPSDSIVAACGIAVEGPLPGTILLGFGDLSAMAMVDAILDAPRGTSKEWGELERSAAQETANIVACAFVNAMAGAIEHDSPLRPGPPEFRLDFAGSLLQGAISDQADRGDRIVLIETRFKIDGTDTDWALVFVPAAGGLEMLGIRQDPGPSGVDSGAIASRRLP